MVRLRQHNGETLSLRAVPDRIVSLVPSITENLVQFGKVPCARTSFCIEPADVVGSIPVVGGTKTLKIDKIIALAPDLVIANREENTREDIESLMESGLSVWITYPQNLEDTLVMMESLSEICGKTKVSQKTLSDIRHFLDAFSTRPASSGFRFLVPIWKDPWMLAGRDTYISHLMEQVGGCNAVMDPASRYPVVSLPEIAAMLPEVVLLPSEPYAFSLNDQRQLETLLPHSIVSSIRGEDLCWAGPRLVSALQFLDALAQRVTA